ncbi:DUF2169 domain-containing protein [Burkholderia cenocepacia]|uniref:DUF2169 family type VI secretion system accessory protein n=1 Tax=Burkholderia cenocepacia TaxID=95486 RepID=UPI000F5BF2D4|nr:DUF2169 domain-containing protein [Burkholderia cenocepacia]RQU99897.1 DUF2169 domain-containing protein [Burkholderia cenocepacia]
MAVITNDSGFPYAWFEKTGEGGAVYDVLAVRGTFDFSRDGKPITLATEQKPIVDGDEFDGEVDSAPLKAVLKREGDRILYKPATDVYLTGTARSAHGEMSAEWMAGLQVGSMQKILRLHGPRQFVRGLLGWRLTRATPTNAVPLDYRLAFGGTYASESEEAAVEYVYKRDNPAGCGWLPDDEALKTLSKDARSQIAAEIGKLKVLAAPQIEDPMQPARHPSQQCAAQGFGPVARWCSPRIDYAGTYDDRWRAEVYPNVPNDFNPRFYQSAPADLIYPGYLAGDEIIILAGLLPEGRVTMCLPNLRIMMAMTTWDGEGRVGALNLDTVAIDLDERQVSLVWRERFDRTDPVNFLRLGVTAFVNSMPEHAHG